jgi:hypothetical protein
MFDVLHGPQVSGQHSRCKLGAILWAMQPKDLG